MSKTDDRIKATYETVPSPQGNGSIKGYLVRPVSADTRDETPAKLPGIIVVHENRGLNPHIEDIARRLALANFMAFAPDGLTSLGGFPGDDYHGGQMFSKVDGKKMAEDFVAAAMWLKVARRLHGQDRRHRFLLRRRHRQYSGRPAGSRFGGRGAVLRRRSRRRGHSEDQGGDSGPSRGARHAAGGDVAGVRQGLDGDQTFRTKAISTRTPFTASIAMRRRNATTRPRPTWPGSARLTGSTNTCAPDSCVGPFLHHFWTGAFASK